MGSSELENRSVTGLIVFNEASCGEGVLAAFHVQNGWRAARRVALRQTEWRSVKTSGPQPIAVVAIAACLLLECEREDRGAVHRVAGL